MYEGSTSGGYADATPAATGTGPAAGPAPANPNTPTNPGPYKTPIPGAAQYGQLIALAQKAYKQSVAELNQERGQLLQQYGYVGQIDPATGLIKNLHVDAHNPYGLYQQTLKAGGQQQDATRANFAARGIRGGLEQAAETANKFAFGKATNDLSQSLQQSLLKLQESQTQDYFSEQQSIVNAQLTALNQAIQMMLSGQTIDPANLAGIQLPQPS